MFKKTLNPPSDSVQHSEYEVPLQCRSQCDRFRIQM